MPGIARPSAADAPAGRVSGVSMSSPIHRWGRIVVVVVALAGVALSSTVQAQCNQLSPNCASQLNPRADELKDFSRRLAGEAFDGPATQVRIRECGPNVRARYVANLPIVLNMCGARGCDELRLPACAVPDGYVLHGNYSSVTRLNDPCPNIDAAGLVVLNPRIGTFLARGSVANCAGVVRQGATWTLEGTISTNTSSGPLREGCGQCYVCHHHTGILKINGLRDRQGCPAASIVAFVQFNTNQTYCMGPVGGSGCNDLDPCEVAFIIQDSTVDGVYRQPCCTAILDDPTGGGHGNPHGGAVDDDVIIDLDDIELQDPNGSPFGLP